MSKINLVTKIPNFLTVLNLLTGLTAIIFLLRAAHPNKDLIIAALVITGGFIDFLDGHLARKLNAATVMGKQLDSFADLVTFGIAPIGLVNSLFTGDHFFIIVISSAIYLMAGVFRLARFNVSNVEGHFLGLPITVSGVSLVIFCALQSNWAQYRDYAALTYITAAIMLLLSFLMVSKFRIKRPGFLR